VKEKGRGTTSRSRSRGRRSYAVVSADPMLSLNVTKVGRRRDRGEATTTGANAPTTTGYTAGGETTLKRPPKTAAVQVTCHPGQCAETMRLARERVNLRNLGISELRPQRARTGALLLEVPGADGAARADAVAREMQEALIDREGIVISRPQQLRPRRSESKTWRTRSPRPKLRRRSLITANVGSPRSALVPSEQGQTGWAWVRCPLVAANRLMRRGHLTLGWTRARLELLPERPTTCFRCLQTGHVRAVCPNETDRGDLCYRCGVDGHLARNCASQPRCPLCVEPGETTIIVW